MPRLSSGISNGHGATRGRAGPRRRRRSRRGVSEVVATIILLALTVVLFSAIFAFVTTFPSPPAQSNNQFQATLTYGTVSGQTVVTAVSILHLAGPSVAPTALVYLKSAAEPAAVEFLNPYNMSQGGIAYGHPWNLGQTWSYTFPAGNQPTTPDNITIYVVSSSSVLFSVILPGQSFILPPTFVATAVAPAIPSIGASFNITATLAGSVRAGSVYVNLAGIWGFNSTVPQKLSYAASTGQYYLLVTSSIGSSTTGGTFYAFLNATSVNGQTAVASLPVTFTTVGGSSPTSTLTVATFLTPAQSPALPAGQQAQSNVETAAALITYSGTATTTLSVSFYANGTTGGRAWTASSWSSTGSSVTITGPATVTIYSNTLWTIPTNSTTFTYQLTAVTTGTGGVGSATGTYTFAPSLGGVWGWCYPAACTTGGHFYSPAHHTCTNATTGSDTCPYFYVKMWDNTTLSGTYSFNLYLNVTGGATWKMMTGSGAIGAGASVQVTAATAWRPTASTKYLVTLVESITTSQGGGTVTFSWGYYTTT
jgi:flagellin-like protein